MNVSDELHRRMIGSLKAAAWERAKGAMREVVALEGSNFSPATAERPPVYRFQVLKTVVECFIEDFEKRGLHE